MVILRPFNLWKSDGFKSLLIPSYVCFHVLLDAYFKPCNKRIRSALEIFEIFMEYKDKVIRLAVCKRL